MGKTLRRPTKEMMLAVNAKIDGKTADVNKLIKEFKLSTAELKKRLDMRDGEKYNLKRKGGRPKGSGRKKTKAGGRTAQKATSIVEMIDGRTKTVTLLRLAYKIEELLDSRPKAELQKIEKAFEQAEELKEKYEEAMALIGEEPPI